VERPDGGLVVADMSDVHYMYSLKSLVPRSQVPLTLFFCSDGQVGQLVHGPFRTPEFAIDVLAECIECVNNRICESLNPATRDRVEAVGVREQEQ
jgi:hypothetical protein